MVSKEKIKQIRLASKLKVPEFAASIGYSKGQYTKVEAGIEKVSEKMITNIQREWTVSDGFLMGDEPMGKIERNVYGQKKTETSVSNPWKEEAYSMVKKELEYWRAIAMKLAGAELGKAKAFVQAGVVKNTRPNA
jgi:transcriptional regulator with XRE-family HTH domain